jgi:hypothetical protein
VDSGHRNSMRDRGVCGHQRGLWICNETQILAHNIKQFHRRPSRATVGDGSFAVKIATGAFSLRWACCRRPRVAWRALLRTQRATCSSGFAASAARSRTSFARITASASSGVIE